MWWLCRVYWFLEMGTWKMIEKSQMEKECLRDLKHVKINIHEFCCSIVSIYWIRTYYEQVSVVNTEQTAMNKTKISAVMEPKFLWERDTLRIKGILIIDIFGNVISWDFSPIKLLIFLKSFFPFFGMSCFLRNKNFSDHFIQPAFSKFLLCAWPSSGPVWTKHTGLPILRDLYSLVGETDYRTILYKYIFL